ncbi:NITA [Symbiodinium sp. KB8]|nr:NITA [Symbiodinium sp. KB8]
MALRLLFVLAATRCAEASLRGNLHASAGSMSTDQLRETVLQEVMAALGTGNRVTDKRLKSIEAVLKPTFVAMPKNEHGKLEDAAARYVLHRLFVQRHAMQIKGLQADGMDWKNVTTSKVLEEHVPSFVLSLFEERLKDQGLGLHELTVLAATLEHLIHDEAVQRLEVVYEAHGLSQDARVKEVALQDLIDTYMTLFLVGSQNFSATSISKERDLIVESYPGWQETRKFTMQVRSSMVADKGSSSDPNFALENFSFRAATEIVEEIGERYGRWQDSECRDLKASLLKSEHAGTGRVLLKDFYSAALGGQWQFSESIEYLRELGALDESDRSHLAVFIPNYVNSQSNCAASSSIYSVCCINECEALMGHLEAKVAAPQAEPKEILEIVASLPSATVRTPRELPETLTARLHEVAAQHGGSVPLHGRLFAQWLHHAYPRECPYPHTAGKTSPMTADEWMQARGQPVSATTEDMKRYVDAVPSAPAPVGLPWSGEEQLVTSTPRFILGSGELQRVTQKLSSSEADLKRRASDFESERQSFAEEKVGWESRYASLLRQCEALTTERSQLTSDIEELTEHASSLRDEAQLQRQEMEEAYESDLAARAFSIKSCLLFCTLSRGVTSVLEREREDAKKEAESSKSQIQQLLADHEVLLQEKQQLSATFEKTKMDMEQAAKRLQEEHARAVTGLGQQHQQELEAVRAEMARRTDELQTEQEKLRESEGKLLQQQKDLSVKYSQLEAQHEQMQQEASSNLQARDVALERTVQTAREQQVELERKLERSHADFEAYEGQLMQLQQEHGSLRQQHTELQQGHDSLQAEHKQLQTDHAGVVQAREQLTSDVENLRREMLQKLQERDEHISTTIVDLRADAEKRLEAKQGELDRLVADFEQERQTLQADISDAKAQLEGHRNELRGTKADLGASEEAAKRLQEEHSTALAQLHEEHARAVTGLGQQHQQELEAVRAEMARRTDELQTEQEKLRESEGKLLQQQKDLSVKYSQLEAQHEQMQQEASSNLQARDAALERTVQTARDQQVELERKLERSRADFEAYEGQLMQLQQEHGSLRQQHTELQQGHDSLQAEHKQLQTDHAGVVQAREHLTSDVENLRREMLQKLQERDEHSSTTIVDLRADAEKRLEAKQGELDRLVADFEQERQTLQADISDAKVALSQQRTEIEERDRRSLAQDLQMSDGPPQRAAMQADEHHKRLSDVREREGADQERQLLQQQLEHLRAKMDEEATEVDARDANTPDKWIKRHLDMLRNAGAHPFNPPLKNLHAAAGAACSVDDTGATAMHLTLKAKVDGKPARYGVVIIDNVTPCESVSYAQTVRLNNHTDQSVPAHGIPGLLLVVNCVSGTGCSRLVDGYAVAEAPRDWVIDSTDFDVHPSSPEGGKMSQHLDSVKIGDSIDFQGLVAEMSMVAGGTGITPCYKVLAAILRDPEDKTMALKQKEQEHSSLTSNLQRQRQEDLEQVQAELDRAQHLAQEKQTELLRQGESFEARVRQLQEQQADLESRHSELQESHSRLASEREALGRDFDGFRAEAAEKLRVREEELAKQLKDRETEQSAQATDFAAQQAKLEQQHADLQQRHEQLNGEHSVALEQKTRLQEEFETFRDESARKLQASQEQMLKTTSELQDEMSQQQKAQQAEQAREREQWTADQDKLRQSLAEECDRKQQLEKTNAELEQRVADLGRDKAKLSSEIEDVLNKSSELRVGAEQRHEQMAEAHRGVVTGLQNDLELERQQRLKVEEERAALEEALRAQRDKVTLLEEKLERTTAEFSEATEMRRQELADRAVEVSAHAAQMEDLRQRNADLEADRARLAEESQRQRTELQEGREGSAKELSVKDAELSTLRDEVRRLEARGDELARQVEAQAAEISQVSGQLHERTQELADTSIQLADRTAESRAHAAGLEDLQQKHTNLEAVHSELVEESQKLRLELEQGRERSNEELAAKDAQIAFLRREASQSQESAQAQLGDQERQLQAAREQAEADRAILQNEKSMLQEARDRAEAAGAALQREKSMLQELLDQKTASSAADVERLEADKAQLSSLLEVMTTRVGIMLNQIVDVRNGQWQYKYGDTSKNNGMGVALVVVLHFVVLVMLVLCVVGPDVVFNRESRCSS